MKPSAIQETVRFQFDYLIKRAIDSTVKNYRRDAKRRAMHEIPFADLSVFTLERISIMDEYKVESVSFEVEGIATVHIHNEKLANALKELKAKKRDIVLMFYCLEISDQEIAKVLKINPATSYRNRKSALAEIQKILQEE